MIEQMTAEYWKAAGEVRALERLKAWWAEEDRTPAEVYVRLREELADARRRQREELQRG